MISDVSAVPMSPGQRWLLLAARASTGANLNQWVSVPLEPAPTTSPQVAELLSLVQLQVDAFRCRMVSRGGRTGLEFARTAPVIELSEDVTDARSWSGEPFKRSQAPLVRARLREAKGHTFLDFVIDHLVFDGWSAGLLHGIVAANWSALVSGQIVDEDAPGSLRNYLVREAQAATSDSLAEYRRFWKDLLKSAENPIIAGTRTGQAQRLVKGLPDDLGLVLRSVRRELSCTDHHILTATFARALANKTGQNALLCFGLVADRMAAEDMNVIGYLVDPIATSIDTSAGVLGAVKSLRSQSINVLRRRKGPFDEVIAGVPGLSAPTLFAQPRLWNASAATASTTTPLLESCPPFPFGDISFSFATDPYTYGFSFDTGFLGPDAARSLAAEFEAELAALKP